jgi:hypothetical protein
VDRGNGGGEGQVLPSVGRVEERQRDSTRATGQ